MKILRKDPIHLTVPVLSYLFLLLYSSVAPCSEPPIIACKTKMTCGETQVLSIMNYRTGNTYTWSISGGGSLSTTTGERVIYTAPDSNPNCQNPTIKVHFNGESSSSITIAVNCDTGNRAAYDAWLSWNREQCNCIKHSNCLGQPRWKASYIPLWQQYKCDGTLFKSGGKCDKSDYTCTGCPIDESWCAPYRQVAIDCMWTNYNLTLGGTTDVRTAAQMAAGCCPEALLDGYEPKPVVPDDIDVGKEAPDKNVTPPICPLDRVGNPISIYNGNNIETEEDLRFASPNLKQLIFRRSYNSQSNRTGPLGYGWSHTYNVFLDPSYEFEGNLYLKITDETGRGIYFEDAGSGHYLGAFKESTTVEMEGSTYVWYRLDNSRSGFNPEGKLIWIEDEIGNRQNLTYDESNRIITVTDAESGRVLTFNYNTDDLLEYISGPVTAAVPDGTRVSYDYDVHQNLVSVTYADGSGFDYIYGDPEDLHNLTEKHNKMGHLLSAWTYDAQDRVIDSFTRDGRGVSIDYVSENEVTVTDAYGITRTYGVSDVDGRRRVTDIEGPSECPKCGNDVVRLEYDSALRVIEVEYANGLINQYDDFDSQDNAQTVILAVGTPEEKTITYTFHPEINAKLSQTKASVLGTGNKVTIWDYDNDGNNIPNENPTRLLSRKIEWGFTTDTSGSVIPYEYITTYAHNSKGQVLSIDGPLDGNQDTTAFTYDSASGDLQGVIRPLIGTTTYSGYDAAGQVGRVTDPNSNAQTYAYDGRGRINTITNEADDSATTYNYNAAGELNSVTDADGITFDFIYNGSYGRLTRVVDPLGNYIQHEYDSEGNCTEISYLTSSDERVYWKRYDYRGPNIPGRLWRIINPDNTFTGYTYDPLGNISSVKDALGRTTVYDYDILKRLTSVIQPGDIITSYGYDTHDNLVTVMDAEGHLTIYFYDDLGRLVLTTSPDTNTTTYTYDAAGNLISKTDANGNTVTYSYDSLNRLIAILFPDSAQDITYTYDDGPNGIGRLTGVADPSGTVTYEYDSQRKLLMETRTIHGHGFMVGYIYSPAGGLVGITYPGGRTVNYYLDGAGQVMRVTTLLDEEETALADYVAHPPFGPITAMSLGNGLSLTETFDQLYRLQTSQAGSVYNRSYTYDSAGNVTGIHDSIDPSRTQFFAYDSLYRLMTASGIYGTISYTYDHVGNRLTKTSEGTTDTYGYMPGTNKLLEISGANPIAFTYDANGNTTNMGDKAFAYNQNNRLIQTAENGTTLGEYLYNGLGQRIVKTANGETTIFVYDQQGNLISEADEYGEIISEYIYLDGRLLAGVKSGIETIEATIDIDPDTLNLESKGKWITCYIELPEEYGVTDIDPTSITLNGAIYSDRTHIGDHDADDIPDLMVKFDRRSVAAILEPGEEVSIKIDGEVGGIPFSGTDTIRVIDKGKRGKKKQSTTKATLPLNMPPETGQQETGLYYYHVDHLGTPQMMTDEDGNVVWAADYKPFGETDVTVSDVGNDFRFPGQYCDQETGLHYNYHRYYDPSTGRYLRADPIGLYGGVNLFVYVHGNPVNRLDPSGLWSSQRGAYVHQKAIYVTIGRNLPRQQHLTLVEAQVYADSPQFQGTDAAYRHAMTGPEQSWLEARRRSNQFVRRQFEKARKLKECGFEDQALFEFGVGLHTLQDWTSPSHHGFQLWTGEETAGELADHIVREVINPGEGSELYRITRDAWEWYSTGQLPSGDLFLRYGADY